MKTPENLIWTFSTLLFFAIGCSKNRSVLVPPPTAIVKTSLIKIEDALNHPNTDL